MKKFPVALIRQENPVYPEKPPYHAPQSFPEYPFKDSLDTTNHVYESVREALKILDFDKENFGSPQWNPLGWLIKPGETVFLKPNMIAHKHQKREEEFDSIITHGSVIRAVMDYVYIALQGQGKILLGDGPQTDSKFDETVKRLGLREIQEFFKKEKNFEIDIVDLRDETTIEEDGIIIDKITLPGDPNGSVEVNLAQDSFFAELDGQGKVFYGALYDVSETNAHHSNGKHEYSISKSPIVADVFISLPKLKTHKKCGITINLKGLVGINANKNWLPHYVFGSPETGGDQFAKGQTKGKLENTLVVNAKKILMKRNPVVQFLAKIGKKVAYKIFGSTDTVVRSGNWHGNDTVWRMSLDLNKILMFANPDATMRPANSPKRFFSLVDGIVGMEDNGPAAGTRKPVGIIVAGNTPVSVDTVCATIMGFDFKKFPIIYRGYDKNRFPLIDGTPEQVEIRSNKPEWQKPLGQWKRADTLQFEPHFAWKGHLELDQ